MANKTVMSDEKILILCQVLELIIGSSLMLVHSRSEFLVPSLGYGSSTEVAVLMSTFSMMLIPLAARLQATILIPSGIGKYADVVIPIFAVWAYSVAGLLSLFCWIRSWSRKNLFYQTFLTSYLLGKGLVSLVLMLVFCLDAACTIVKNFKAELTMFEKTILNPQIPQPPMITQPQLPQPTISEPAVTGYSSKFPLKALLGTPVAPPAAPPVPPPVAPPIAPPVAPPVQPRQPPIRKKKDISAPSGPTDDEATQTPLGRPKVRLLESSQKTNEFQAEVTPQTWIPARPAQIPKQQINLQPQQFQRELPPIPRQQWSTVFHGQAHPESYAELSQSPQNRDVPHQLTLQAGQVTAVMKRQGPPVPSRQRPPVPSWQGPPVPSRQGPPVPSRQGPPVPSRQNPPHSHMLQESPQPVGPAPQLPPFSLPPRPTQPPPLPPISEHPVSRVPAKPAQKPKTINTFTK